MYSGGKGLLDSSVWQRWRDTEYLTVCQCFHNSVAQMWKQLLSPLHCFFAQINLAPEQMEKVTTFLPLFSYFLFAKKMCHQNHKKERKLIKGPAERLLSLTVSADIDALIRHFCRVILVILQRWQMPIVPAQLVNHKAISGSVGG